MFQEKIDQVNSLLNQKAYSLVAVKNRYLLKLYDIPVTRWLSAAQMEVEIDCRIGEAKLVRR